MRNMMFVGTGQHGKTCIFYRQSPVIPLITLLYSASMVASFMLLPRLKTN